LQTSGGAELTFTNWCSGEPNDHLNEDCGVLSCWSLEQCGCWNDLQCGAYQPYVCEKPQHQGMGLRGLAPVR